MSAPTRKVGRTTRVVGGFGIALLASATLVLLPLAWWLPLVALLGAGVLVAARMRARCIERRLEAIARGASKGLPFPWRTPKKSGLVLVRRKRAVRSAG